MKYAILFLLLVLPVAVFGQSVPTTVDNVFTPNLLTAGTAMTSRTVSATMDDTTRSVSLRGWHKVYINVIQLTGDSASVHIQYQPSYNGVTWDPTFVTIDSLRNTTNGAQTYISAEVPAKAMGLSAVRFRLLGKDFITHSANPSGTVKVEIVRKH